MDKPTITMETFITYFIYHAETKRTWKTLTTWFHYLETRGRERRKEGGRKEIINKKIRDRIKQNCSTEMLKLEGVEGRVVVLDRRPVNLTSSHSSDLQISHLSQVYLTICFPIQRDSVIDHFNEIKDTPKSTWNLLSLLDQTLLLTSAASNSRLTGILKASHETVLSPL